MKSKHELLDLETEIRKAATDVVKHLPEHLQSRMEKKMFVIFGVRPDKKDLPTLGRKFHQIEVWPSLPFNTKCSSVPTAV